jgi:hypothetical protein
MRLAVHMFLTDDFEVAGISESWREEVLSWVGAGIVLLMARKSEADQKDSKRFSRD